MNRPHWTAASGLRHFILASLALLVGSQALAQIEPDEALPTLARVKAEEAELQRFDQLEADAVGEDVAFFLDLTRRQQELLGDELDELLDGDGEEALSVEESSAVAEIIRADIERSQRLLRNADAQMRQLRKDRVESGSDSLLRVELDLTAVSAVQDGLMAALIEHHDRLAALGLDVSTELAELEQQVQLSADLVAARIKTTVARSREVDRRLRATPADSQGPLQAEQSALREKLHGTTASLERLLTVLESRGGEVSNYRRLLVEATGQIGAAMTDSRIATGLIQDWVQRAREWLSVEGPDWFLQLLVFLAVLFAAWVISRLVKRGLARALRATDVERSQLLERFILSLVSKAILVLGLLFALSQVGIEIGPALAGLGVVGFVVGFALQDSLSNFASGVMILLYQPYDVGDSIDAGSVSGTVESMNLVSTTVLTPDNKKLIVPNNKIWGNVIQNVTVQTTRRVDLVFGVGYEQDVDHVERVLLETVKAHELVLEEPAPRIELHELADSSVNFICRPWTRTDDYWTVYWDLQRAIKLRFDEAGISFPYPQREVLVRQDSAVLTDRKPEEDQGQSAGD